MTDGVCRGRGKIVDYHVFFLYLQIEHLSNMRKPAMSRPLSDNPAETAPKSPPAAPLPTPPLTQRQEDFCRHYAATGNAAGAARDAGYAAGSARQTGHDLLERPAV
ncbi:MAG: hypothetical protein F4050_08920, partial [Rhodospirillaceae bacterium]|nr:hypothetical protein [Rhodospirillaceae bacterium]